MCYRIEQAAGRRSRPALRTRWHGMIPLWICLTASLLPPIPARAAGDPVAPILRVDGVAIISLRPATRVGVEWFVPLAPIADAVGATLSVIPGGFRVLHRDGVIVDYDSSTGRFRQGNMLVGELQDFRQVQITGPVGTVLFPLTGAVILLGVTVREDLLANVLEIESLPAVSGGNANGPRFQASKLDYLDSLTTTGPSLGQFLNLNGEALLGTDRLTGTLTLNQVPGSDVPELRQASARLELPHHRAISLGDQGTGVGLDAMSNAVRGVGYEQPIGPFQAVFHVGLAVSSVNSALGSSGTAVYGSTFADFGLRWRFHTAARRRPDLFIGGNSFRGASRNGTTFGVGYSDLVLANQFRVQALVGSFSGDSDRQILVPVIPGVGSQGAPADPAISGTAQDGTAVLESSPIHVQGAGYGLSISDSINPFHNKWTLIGSWELYSQNFLTVQAFSQFSAVKRRSVSTALQPVRYLSFSAAINDSAYTLGIPEGMRGYNYGANVSLPIRIPLQLAYFHTSQTYSGLSAGRFAMDQCSLQLPRLGRYSAGAGFSEFRVNGQTGHIANGTLSASMERFGRLGFHYQSQLGSNANAGMDWSRDFGKKKDSYIRAGVERQTARGQTTIFAPVISAGLPLPRGQTLTVSYMSVRGWSIFQLALGGSLLGHRQMLQVDGVGMMLVQASLSGQVYWDTNANGKFDAAVDHPLPPLQVSLDGERTTVTDASGYFRFDHVNPGTHRLRAAMDNVPARLVFADGEEHMAAVIPYRENRRDFRAVEAGQIHGRVMLVQEGFFAKEPPLNPLPDAHILTSRDRDTFTEGDGTFLLGDLVPGTYMVRLDPASVPRGLVPAPASRTVVVIPGQTVGGVEFRLARPVIEKQAIPQK